MGEAYRSYLRALPPEAQAAFWDEIGGEPDVRVLAFCLAALAEVEPPPGGDA